MELTQPPVMLSAPSSAYIIDGMAMLHGLKENHFRTFEDLAEVVLKRLMRILKDPSLDVKSVSDVFDRYDVKILIKGLERQRRSESSTTQTYHILGKRLIPNYRQFLRTGKNKTSLAQFVSQYVLNHAQK